MGQEKGGGTGEAALMVSDICHTCPITWGDLCLTHFATVGLCVLKSVETCNCDLLTLGRVEKNTKNSFVVDQDNDLNNHNINDHFSWKYEAGDS